MTATVRPFPWGSTRTAAPPRPNGAPAGTEPSSVEGRPPDGWPEPPNTPEIIDFALSARSVGRQGRHQAFEGVRPGGQQRQSRQAKGGIVEPGVRRAGGWAGGVGA